MMRSQGVPIPRVITAVRFLLFAIVFFFYLFIYFFFAFFFFFQENKA